MPSRGVIRRDRRTHSNLRPKHKHTKHYLQHYWPYLPLVSLVLVGLWLLRPMLLPASAHDVLAVATNVSSQNLLEETNKQRLAQSRPQLRLNNQLTLAAQSKAQDMVNLNYWSHNTPSGNPPWTFINESGYQYQKAGENLAYGFADSSDTINGWMNSQSHRENLLDKDFVEVGFGTASSNDFNHEGPSTVIVAMYGRSAHESPVVSLSSNNTSPSSTTTTTTSTNATSTPISSSKAQEVSKLNLLTGNKFPWLPSLVSFLMGIALTVFVLKHGFAVKRALRKGERFAVTHPVLDVVLVSVIIAGLVITRQVGVIL